MHCTLQRWVRLGVSERHWAVLVEGCRDLGGVSFERQAAGRAMEGALWGDLVGKNPTDRGKPGVKRSLAVERAGGPLALALAGADAHDATPLAATPDRIVAERPVGVEEHLCRDQGDDDPTGEGAAVPPPTAAVGAPAAGAPRADPEDPAYSVVSCRDDVGLPGPARAAGRRWLLGEGSEAAKPEVGPADDEVRGDRGWHRHATLAMPALAAPRSSTVGLIQDSPVAGFRKPMMRLSVAVPDGNSSPFGFLLPYIDRA